MDHGLLEKSLTGYATNTFTNWLVKLFGGEITEELIGRYLIGSSDHWAGATVFWQIAIDGSIRTGKVMLYGDDGRRVKKPFNHITWVHALLRKSGSRESQQSPEDKNPAVQRLSDFRSSGLSDYNLQQCFFGEHLLKEEPLKPVAIVESEKSAIIAGVYLPRFIWLAAGALSNLNAEKCQVLKGRNVTLFPDLNCFDKWQQKATAIGMGFKVSPLLELSANDEERAAGLDLADYLLKYDYREFITPNAKPEQASPENYSISDHQPILNLFAQTFGCDTDQVQYRKEQIYKRPVWDDEISGLETYFKNTKLPAGPVRLNNCTVIDDPQKFVNNHLEMVKQNNGKPWFKVYLERLSWLKNFMESAK